VEPKLFFRHAEKVNGRPNPLQIPSLGNFRAHYIRVQNGINQLADILYFYDGFVPYFLQVPVLVVLLTLYWYVAMSRLWGVLNLGSMLYKLDQRAN